MCKGRTHARICLETERDLRDLITATELAESKGHIDRWWGDDRLTMAEMIAELVRREFAHRARSAEARLASSRRRRNARAAAAALSVSADDLAAGHYDLEAAD